MKSGGWARNHSLSRRSGSHALGVGILANESSIHATTRHHPTHAGRDARGPQNGAGPPNSGLTGRGGASSWESRRPRWPSISAWNGEVRVGTESLPSPVALGGKGWGWGASTIKAPSMSQLATTPPMRAGMPADHKSAPAHQPHHCPMPARAPALPGTHIHACRRRRSHGPTSVHSHPPQISADQEAIASRRSYPLPDNTR